MTRRQASQEISACTRKILHSLFPALIVFFFPLASLSFLHFSFILFRPFFPLDVSTGAIAVTSTSFLHVFLFFLPGVLWACGEWLMNLSGFPSLVPYNLLMRLPLWMKQMISFYYLDPTALVVQFFLWASPVSSSGLWGLYEHSQLAQFNGCDYAHCMDFFSTQNRKFCGLWRFLWPTFKWSVVYVLRDMRKRVISLKVKISNKALSLS